MAKRGVFLIGLLAWGGGWAVPTGFQLVPESSLPEARLADELYRKGLTSLVAGDLAAAEQAFRESIRRYPRAVHAMLGLAEIAFKRNQLKEAGSWIYKAVEKAPDDPYAQTSLGRYLRLNRQFEQAMAAFRTAAELDPKAVEPRLALGDLYLTVFGNPQQAVKAYQSAVAIDPNRAAAHYALGVAQFKRGDPTSAVAELGKASRLEPENPLPQLELARVYLNLNRPHDALSAVNSALRLQPALLEAGLLRGDILLAQGKPAQAEADYTRLAERNPKAASPHLHLAMLYQQLGRRDKADQAYRSAIAIDPKLALAYNNLAVLLSEQKQSLAEAESMAKKAVELAPTVAHFHDTLGWIYRTQGKLTEAYQALSKAVQLSPDDPAISAHWGRILADCGDRSGAMIHLERALKHADHFPGSAEASSLLNTLRQEETSAAKPMRACSSGTR